VPISTFLNNRNPIRLRGAMWLAFTDTAVISRRSMTSDSGGGGTLTYAAAGTVPCRIYPVTIRGKGALVGGQVNERSTHFCAMPPGGTVLTSDRIAISGRGTFEVTISLETTDAFTTRVEVIQI
jgi:hypothetical protein